MRLNMLLIHYDTISLLKKLYFLRLLQDFYFLACYNLHVRISKIAVSLDDTL